MLTTTDTLISTRDAARLLGISDRTIRRMLEEGILEGKKIRKQWRMWKSSVLKQPAERSQRRRKPSRDVWG
jgi:excisionase family DNA binding protein